MLLNAEEKRSKLFSVNINDFPNNVTKEELELFADDSTAAKVCNSQENAFTAAQDLLDEVDSYSGRNGFQVHTDREKTEIMLTSKKPFIGPHYQTLSLAINVSVASNIKCLGLLIDNKLLWDSHCLNTHRFIHRKRRIFQFGITVLSLYKFCLLYTSPSPRDRG